MKNYRKSLSALVLALALSASAFAGEMHTGVVQPPPPPPPAAAGEITTMAAGHIEMGIALGLLQNLLALL